MIPPHFFNNFVTKVDLMNKGLRRIEQFHGGVSLHVPKVDLMKKGLRPKP